MGFVLYRSSAGSGKTYTLVKEYLKLVLEDPEKFKHILAITFTNKAAGEMKERILGALKQLKKKENPELEQILLNENPKLRNIDILSDQLLTKLLHEYSDFAVMTIDSFTHRVIKAFALEIGLPLNFKIALNYDNIQTYVIERLLGDVGHDKDITEMILDFVRSKMISDKSWNVEPDIKAFEKEVMSEKNVDWVRAVSGLDTQTLAHFLKELELLVDGYLKPYNELGHQALDMITGAGLEMGDFSYGKNGVYGFLLKCKALKRGGIKKFELSKRLINEEFYTKKAPRKEDIETILDSGLATMRNGIIDHFQTNHAKAITAVYVLDNFYLLGIVNQIRRLTDEYKIKNNVIPISEFNEKVYEIVKDSPVPFIYAILGERYNHYLIDEFQDTSRMQWENLYPLIDNTLASDYFCMSVGDGKQSIYRWRGGDVEIMEEDIGKKIDPAQLQVKPLERNFRSRSNLVEFNNRFFESIRASYRETGDNRLLEGIYSDIAQEPARKQGGFVSLRFIEEVPENVEPDELILETVFRTVKDCIDKYNYHYNDIAVLVRENKHGQKVAEYLLENGVPVISPDSLLLPRIPLVRFLIDVLSYLNNPNGRIEAFSIVHFLAVNRAQNPLDSQNVVGAFHQGNPWELSPQILEFFKRREYLIRMPVYELTEEIIRVFQLDTVFHKKTAGYLQAFLEVVEKYTEENSMDASSFLDWWEIHKDTEKERFALAVPENKNAVRIMSIHKAKGLEFPVVILPYANWQHKMDDQLWLTPAPPLPTEPPLAFPVPVKYAKALDDSYFKAELDEEKEKVVIDNINMLYVAFTRAVDNLHIIAYQKAQKSNGKKSSSKKEEEKNNFYHLKESAVPLMVADPVVLALVPDPLANPVSDYYTYGQPVINKPKESKPAPVAVTKDTVALGEVEFDTVETLVSNKWYSRITIRRKSTEFWRFVFPEDERVERRKWGILVHQVLEHIHVPDDLPLALERVVISGDIKAKERGTLEGHIREIIDLPEAREWFSPKNKVYTEWPIITDEGVLRPDRVVQTENDITVIDFKTGEKNKHHEAQIIKYKNALRKMGHKNVHGYLFYLEFKETQKV